MGSSPIVSTSIVDVTPIFWTVRYNKWGNFKVPVLSDEVALRTADHFEGEVRLSTGMGDPPDQRTL